MMNGVNRSVWSVCLSASLLMAATGARGAAEDMTLYVGAAKCKMCHSKAATGDQYGKWLAGPHGKAFDALASDQAKAVAAKMGIADAQKSGKCLKCHSTAYHWTEAAAIAAIPAAEGVSCESCHGPGQNYKSMKVMKDREQSIANGMIYPATKNCTKCHNEGSPTWQANRYTKGGTPTGFDVDQAFEKIKHPNPAGK